MDLDAPQPTPNGSNGSSPSRSSREGARRSYYHARRKYSELQERHRQLQRLFVAATGGLAVLAVALGGWALSETQQNRRVSAGRYKEQSALRDVKAALANARSEIDALVAGRIPHLEPIAFDRVVPIGRDYVRNVAFTVARRAERDSYEYKLVVQNETEIMTRPQVDILLFDHVGIEIGRARVGVGAAAVEDVPAKHTLYPGEVRSYAGTVDLARSAEPAYFLVETR